MQHQPRSVSGTTRSTPSTAVRPVTAEVQVEQREPGRRRRGLGEHAHDVDGGRPPRVKPSAVKL